MQSAGKLINHFQRLEVMWEPVGAIALSIFMAVSLFFTVCALSYLGISLCIAVIKRIKKKIKTINEKEER
tara:strand:+ start:886 stop:1095 length:210 start_codon:yes stop_codon:yes gene_type:complete